MEVEKVSIQEASRRLNVSQDVIRSYIRKGELKASREGGATGRQWLVELPEEGWLDDFKTRIEQLDRGLTRWWWTSPSKRGGVHYVESLGIEEIHALFLCKGTSGVASLATRVV